MNSKTLLAIALATLAAVVGCRQANAAWKPVSGNLMTRWAADVSPTNARPEYPRPMMTRPDWLNLNGLWQFRTAVDGEAAPIGQTLAESILVPYPVESALSGLGRHESRMWYRRTFDVPAGWTGKRILLNFDAVDWQATVIVNGKQVGSHRGGYDRFSFDITSALNATGPQELIVFVYDPTDQGSQPRGKQVISPTDIWFSPASGIWGTVWLEPVPSTRIASIHTTPDIDAGTLRLAVQMTNPDAALTVKATVTDAGAEVTTLSGPASAEMTIPVPSPKLWTPDSPHLYDLTVDLYRGTTLVDEIGSYFGMRKISIGKDAKGITRILLNGSFVFQVGPLDQGFWPDGIYTAPTDDALKYDIQIEKRFGFNMIRKHIKVEPDRWYYWCDKLGMLVWQDMPSGNNSDSDAHIQFELEMKRMIQSHWNYPSIVMWIVFNEGWGQYDTARIANRAKAIDPSRLVNNATGWNDAGVGDIVDKHIYPGPGCFNPEPTRASVNGECGNVWVNIPGHLWTRAGFTYDPTYSPEEGAHNYYNLMQQAYVLRDNPGMSGLVFTENVDVETERAGLITYDRAVNKVDPDRASPWTKGVFTAPPYVTMVAPTSQSQYVTWRYTTTSPTGSWTDPAYVDTAWSQGGGGFGLGVSGVNIGTNWNTADIWLRREFTLASNTGVVPVVRSRHDDDIEVYINGVLAVQDPGWCSAYWDIPVLTAARSALQTGRNVIAVHCHNATGGQFVDAGIGTIPGTP